MQNVMHQFLNLMRMRRTFNAIILSLIVLYLVGLIFYNAN